MQDWTPDDWQKEMNRVLRLYYVLLGSNYQRIPDVSGGDGGIEGVTSCGHAYQMYADQDSNSTKERAKKQRKKLNDDLAKLEANREFFSGLLGEQQLMSWTLVVPRLDDKNVVKHGRTLGRALAKKGITYLAPKFEVRVCTRDDFDVGQRGAVFAAGAVLENHEAHVPPPSAAHQDVMAEKLGRVPPLVQTGMVEEIRTDLIKRFMEAENSMDALRARVPDVWNNVVRIRTSVAGGLRLQGALSPLEPHQRLNALVERVASLYQEVGAPIDSTLAETLAWGTVAKWLFECPLDFPVRRSA